MTRIFLTLAALETLLLGIAFWMGFAIGDAADPAEAGRFTAHFMTGLAALVFATLVHSLVLTYFMGTGRWLDETCVAYRLGPEFTRRNRDLKWRVLPFLGACVLLLLVTGGFGAAADPAAAVEWNGAWGLSAAGFHQATSALTLGVNTAIHVLEYLALRANLEVVNAVVKEVRRMRLERGLA